MSKKRLLWLVVLVAAIGLSLLTLASARKLRASGMSPGKPVESQNSQVRVNPNRSFYVRPGSLRPQLTQNLMALGDRLEKPGKERLTITGTFERSGDPRPGAFALVLEFPDRLRLTIQNGLQPRVITFDGEVAKAVGPPVNSDERDIIETLIYDGADHFFTAQAQGQATRFLGGRFRMDDGSAANYSGPFYDIYQVGEQVKASADGRQQTKHFYFNSDTLLLERVRYQVNRDGSEVSVESRIGNWQRLQGQQVPGRIERIENGKSVFTLTLSSDNLSARLDDGVFGG